jgi:polyhydroxybutyrate depolymerase
LKRWARRLAIAFITALLGLVVLLVGLYSFLSRADSELVSSGETRKYLIHVPDGYRPATPAPLVISLHGAWLYPGMQKRLTNWNNLADKNGFIVAYPRARGFPREWRLKPGSGLDAELRFFADLLDELSASFNIDPTRIYVNGYSNGAAMTFMLSCSMADRFAAFGMVATPVVPWSWCKDQRPVPMLAFHGTADPYAPYAGGENFLTTEPLPSMGAWMSRWAERNQCAREPRTTLLSEDLTSIEYMNCAQDSTARLFALADGGHIWPGGLKLPELGTGHYSASINATEEMWAFFQRHPLRLEKHDR